MSLVFLSRARRAWVAAAVVTAVAATPRMAWACWELCTDKYGYWMPANGTWYELQYCTQSWPDGATGPRTTCYYQRA